MVSVFSSEIAPHYGCGMIVLSPHFDYRILTARTSGSAPHSPTNFVIYTLLARCNKSAHGRGAYLAKPKSTKGQDYKDDGYPFAPP